LKRILTQSDTGLLDDIYLSSIARFPTAEEKQRLLGYLAARKTARPQAVQDIVWALLNTKEFEFNH
jgi:hypothetical protein